MDDQDLLNLTGKIRSELDELPRDVYERSPSLFDTALDKTTAIERRVLAGNPVTQKMGIAVETIAVNVARWRNA